MPNGSNSVIDISHHNGPDLDFERAVQDGIVGVIHKATQGSRGVDPHYASNRDKARKAGLLWGAYHFGTGADGDEQAEHFLDVVGNDPETLLVLDLGPNPTGPTMTLGEARTFVSHVEQATGRFPGLYSGHFIKEKLGTDHDPILAECWLWLAQFGRAAIVPPNWPTWTLWQYTDGALGPGPHEVAGIGHCDRDVFNGTVDQLRQFWRAA